MAGKPRNRLELRRQLEAAEDRDPMEETGDDLESDETEGAKPKRKTKPAPKKARAPKAPKASKTVKPAARMRVVWQVVSDAFKVIATYDYNQKDAADSKAAELTARGKGTHFVQRAKEAMDDEAPGLGASIPRSVPKPTKARAKAAAAEEEFEEDDIEEPEEDDEEDEDDED